MGGPLVRTPAHHPRLAADPRGGPARAGPATDCQPRGRGACERSAGQRQSHPLGRGRHFCSRRKWCVRGSRGGPSARPAAGTVRCVLGGAGPVTSATGPLAAGRTRPRAVLARRAGWDLEHRDRPGAQCRATPPGDRLARSDGDPVRPAGGCDAADLGAAAGPPASPIPQRSTHVDCGGRRRRGRVAESRTSRPVAGAAAAASPAVATAQAQRTAGAGGGRRATRGVRSGGTAQWASAETVRCLARGRVSRGDRCRHRELGRGRPGDRGRTLERRIGDTHSVDCGGASTAVRRGRTTARGLSRSQ